MLRAYGEIFFFFCLFKTQFLFVDLLLLELTQCSTHIFFQIEDIKLDMTHSVLGQSLRSSTCLVIDCNREICYTLTAERQETE